MGNILGFETKHHTPLSLTEELYKKINKINNLLVVTEENGQLIVKMSKMNIDTLCHINKLIDFIITKHHAIQAQEATND